MQFTTPGGVAENVLHFLVSAPEIGPDVLDAIGLALANWWHSDLRVMVPSSIALQRIVLTDLSAEGSYQTVYTTDLPDTGTSTFAHVPDNVTVAVRKGSGFSGRSNRGRIFHVGLNIAQIVGDQIDDAAQDALNDAYSALMTLSPVGATVDFVIVSYCNDGAWRTTANLVAVTEIGVDPNIDSQRRRLAGRGI